MVDGVAQAPVAGVNERDLEPGREARLAPAQKIAVFPPHLQPAGGTTMSTVVPLERAAGLRAAEEAQRWSPPSTAAERSAKPVQDALTVPPSPATRL
jgi:hypothetical protein